MAEPGKPPLRTITRSALRERRDEPAVLSREAKLPDDRVDRRVAVRAQEIVELGIDPAQRARAFLDQRRTDLHRLGPGQVREVGVAPRVDSADRDDIERTFGFAIEGVYLRQRAGGARGRARLEIDFK